MHWDPGAQGVDLRPHVYDNVLKQWLLIDSGSQVTAVPPDEGDVEDPDVVLKAVNGTKIKCLGKKEIVIRIGRKSYKYTAIKAQADSPVLGWDFVRFHKLNFIWNIWVILQSMILVKRPLCSNTN